MSYCPGLPLYSIVITTYSDIESLSKSASLIRHLQSAYQSLASCNTFCLNLTSPLGLCQVQVVIHTQYNYAVVTPSISQNPECSASKKQRASAIYYRLHWRRAASWQCTKLGWGGSSQLGKSLDLNSSSPQLISVNNLDG